MLRLVSEPHADAGSVAFANRDADRRADVDAVGHADSVADTEPDYAADVVAHRSAAHAFEHADTAAIAGAVGDALYVGAVVRDDAMLELWRHVLLERGVVHLGGRYFLSERVWNRRLRMLRQLSVGASDSRAFDAAVGRAHRSADRAALRRASSRADASSDDSAVAQSDAVADDAADACSVDGAVHERAHVHRQFMHELRRCMLFFYGKLRGRRWPVSFGRLRRELLRMLRLVSEPRADAGSVAFANRDAHHRADVDAVGHADSVTDTEPDYGADSVAHRSAAHAFEHADTAAIAGAVGDALYVGAVVRDDAMLELWRHVLLERGVVHLGGRYFLSERVWNRRLRMLRQLSVGAAQPRTVRAAVGAAHVLTDLVADECAYHHAHRIPDRETDRDANHRADGFADAAAIGGANRHAHSPAVELTKHRTDAATERGPDGHAERVAFAGTECSADRVSDRHAVKPPNSRSLRAAAPLRT